jgi:hypothetical protein
MALDAWALREQFHWRQLQSFGGFLWPDVQRVERSHQRPMTLTECLDEVEWLLDGGVPAGLAVEQIGRSVDSLRRAAERRGRLDLARRIGRAKESEWERRWAPKHRRTA